MHSPRPTMHGDFGEGATRTKGKKVGLPAFLSSGNANEDGSRSRFGDYLGKGAREGVLRAQGLVFKDAWCLQSPPLEQCNEWLQRPR
jgi:hypothetical protein